MHKSMGPDMMHTGVMRKLADEIAKTLFFEKSWRSGRVPSNLKRGNVTPTFKKGKQEGLGSCRPVSLTVVPGKIME